MAHTPLAVTRDRAPKGTRYGLRVTDLPTMRATRESCNAIAPTYAQPFHDTLRDRPVERALLLAFAELVLTTGQGDAGVADLGCGPGYVTAHLHRWV